jgi:hypothetical protein
MSTSVRYRAALWLEKTDGDVQQVEAVLNRVHLHNELHEDDPDDSVLMEIGRIMKQYWAAALAKQSRAGASRLNSLALTTTTGRLFTCAARAELPD